jgi:chloramphenicol-sensitive protein RarD
MYLLLPTIAFLAVEGARGTGAFGRADVPTHVFLVLAGVVTGVPLIWFANGARRIPLSTVGFLQYITPTLHLLFGVVVYGEPFTVSRAVSFGMIWAAIALYAATTTIQARRRPAAGGSR